MIVGPTFPCEQYPSMQKLKNVFGDRLFELEESPEENEKTDVSKEVSSRELYKSRFVVFDMLHCNQKQENWFVSNKKNT